MKIYYINLDQRLDRKHQIEAELNNMGLIGERYPAIFNENAPIGCSESHLNLLKKIKEEKLEKAIIFEDDFRFIVDKKFLNSFFKQISEVDFDLIMMGYNLIRSEPYNDFLGKVLEAQTASGYIVHSKFYDKLISCWEEGLELYKKYPQEHWNYINDMYWKRLQPISNWYYSLNRIGRQRSSYSDLSKIYKEEQENY